MLNNFFRRVLGLALAISMAASLAVSCYDDSELRASIDDLKTQLSQLQTIVSNLQNDDAVVSVTPNSDGSYTIKFKKSADVTIKNGISVEKTDADYIFTFPDGTTVVLPRDYEPYVLTFEDADYKGPVDITNYWTSLIDDPQYGGELLYGTGCTWVDENNTFLSGSVLPYDPETWSGGFSGGGIAISNYGSNNLIEADYLHQLDVYSSPAIASPARSSCGNNGSDNFAVVYDGGEWASNPAALVMSDGEARIIESAYVNFTCYTLSVLVYGNDYAAAMADNGFYKITATGYRGGNPTGSTDHYLAKNTYFDTRWVKWDLVKLGFVDKIVFSVSGSPEQYGDWGFNTPAYFALDDVVVRVYAD